SEKCLSFRRLRLHVVAVQVESLAVGTLPNLRGAVLLWAVRRLRSDTLVAIGVVDRDYHKHERVEHIGPRARDQIEEGGEHGLFPLDLARVDIGVYVDHWAAERVSNGARGNSRTGRND